MNNSANLHLNEPETTDQYNIAHFNENSEIIDRAITQANTNIANLTSALAQERQERIESETGAADLSNVTGVLPVEHGGTASSTEQAALARLISRNEAAQSVAAGDKIMTKSASDSVVRDATVSQLADALWPLHKDDANVFSPSQNGLVPDSSQAPAGAFLSASGTWAVPVTGGGGGGGGGGVSGSDISYPFDKFRFFKFDFSDSSHKSITCEANVSIRLTITESSVVSYRWWSVSDKTSIDMTAMMTEAANAAALRTGSTNGRVFNIFLVPDSADGVKLVLSTLGDCPSDIDQSYTTDNSRWVGCFSTLCVSVPANTTATIPAGPGTGFTGQKSIVKSIPLIEDWEPYREFYEKPLTGRTNGTYYDVLTVEHPLSGFKAGDILPESVWCLGFLPGVRGDPSLRSDILGMVYDPDTDVAVDIYLQSGQSRQTTTVYGATHTVSRQQQNHEEDMHSVGKKLISDDEFTSAALGSNEKTSIQGSADQTTVGGHVDTAGRRMISFIGCEEMCGYLWQWTRVVSANGGSNWGTYDGHASFGQTYGASYALLAGGLWTSAACCGSRARAAKHARSAADASIGGRGVSRVIRNA